MNMVLVRNWWALGLRGLAAILFGLIALFSPGFMALWLALLFGAYAVIDGVFAIIAGIRAAERHERWWPFALEGLASILVGVIAFVMPVAAALALLYLVSAWAILTGVFRISAAIRLRKEIRGEWMLILNGALSVLLGILIVRRPGGRSDHVDVGARGVRDGLRNRAGRSGVQAPRPSAARRSGPHGGRALTPVVSTTPVP